MINPRLLSEADLADLGVEVTVENLWREMVEHGFPAPYHVESGLHFWRSDEVDAYLAARNAGRGIE